MIYGPFEILQDFKRFLSEVVGETDFRRTLDARFDLESFRWSQISPLDNVDDSSEGKACVHRTGKVACDYKIDRPSSSVAPCKYNFNLDGNFEQERYTRPVRSKIESEFSILVG